MFDPKDYTLHEVCTVNANGFTALANQSACGTQGGLFESHRQLTSGGNTYIETHEGYARGLRKKETTGYGYTSGDVTTTTVKQCDYYVDDGSLSLTLLPAVLTTREYVTYDSDSENAVWRSTLSRGGTATDGITISVTDDALSISIQQNGQTKYITLSP